MGHRLREHLSSEYLEAANRLNSKRAKRRIVAYVESYDDVFFWRSVLGKYENEKLYFQVMLPSRVRHLERGKKAVLMNLLSEKIGTDMITCVDADYDYLIQGATSTSRTVINNPYVFHTYAYAIENLQCYAPSLHDVCVMVTLNDHAIFNFTEYIRLFSEAIYPLFVWNIWFYRTPNYKDFTITNFLHVIETGNFSIQHAEDILQNVRQKVDKKVEQLKKNYPNAKDSYLKLKDDLQRLGVTPDTTYLYIQGHHLFDKVVLPMLNKVCDKLIRERENEITRQSLHNTQRRNELSCYSNSVGDIASMLKRNTGYLFSEPFKRIEADVKRFVSAILPATESSPHRTTH